LQHDETFKTLELLVFIDVYTVTVPMHHVCMELCGMLSRVMFDVFIVTVYYFNKASVPVCDDVIDRL